ncbi:M20/M25/M40 family metallo-hydrolase [bacterium]|nr:MAG: M20/M25/M40 family metallo-hydrolase [bacterium]
MKRFLILFSALCMFIFSFELHAQFNPADTLVAFNIKKEAIENSKVMELLNVLTNVIGPRLTNSKGMAAANAWSQKTLESYGLTAQVEAWGEFGRGWDVKSFRAGVTAPYAFQLIAYPKAWSPATIGAVKGKIIYVNEKNLEAVKTKYDGKLKNAIVLLGEKIKVEPSFEPAAKRVTDAELLAMANASQKDEPRGSYRAQFRNSSFYPAYVERSKIFTWVNEQQPALILDGGTSSSRMPGRNSGVVTVQSANTPLLDEEDVFGRKNPKPYDVKPPFIAPQVVIAAEQFNQLAELIINGKDVKLECDLQVDWQNKDTKGYNTIAEWEGSDLKDEIVMIGAHMDSWHGATGATDNAAGVAVMMEAVRILKQLDIKPRRTIRVGLWSGEEQGLLGSRNYVAKHLKDSMSTKPDYEKFNVYYNLDNGGGQIRGIHMQGNEKAAENFRQWLEPFRAWDASTISLKKTGSTDHAAFDDAGLPGFQFIQDPLEYGSKTWHTNMDMPDHIVAQDMRRNAAIVAYFVYQSAMQDERLPRK